jgi:hypothetical protein
MPVLDALEVSDPVVTAGDSCGALVGRHGATKPAGKARGGNGITQGK